ncbi:MAG: hypothetical protein J6Y60_05520 [Treponema sp.]|nr:hypothetical protein [Treponema sp.]
MKKLCISLLFLSILTVGFSQTSNQNEEITFNGLKLKTSCEEFLNKNPSAEKISSEYEPEIQEYKCSTDENESAYYYFFQNQLYAVKDVFFNGTTELSLAIINRLKELYGKAYKVEQIGYDEKTGTYETKSITVDYKTIFYYDVETHASWKVSDTQTIEYCDRIVQPKTKSYEDAFAIALFVTSSPLTISLNFSDEKMLAEVEKFKEQYDKQKEQEKIDSQKSKLRF